MSKRCLAKNRRGKRCGAWAVAGKVKCALHLDPEWAAQIGSKHGRRLVLPSPSETALLSPPKTAGDVRDVLANTISQVQSRNMDVRIANSLAYLATSLLRAIEVADLERRLVVLESERTLAIEPA